jgi:hypothetical protein
MDGTISILQVFAPIDGKKSVFSTSARTKSVHGQGSFLSLSFVVVSAFISPRLSVVRTFGTVGGVN